ncbi:LapA family protein [Marinobacter sp. SS21]|uniref:LapA family protein n=1 Tax=Marinobacter sp. SS21 TaxID=2979460 RepID=UPI0023314ACA|nr:LapA family protein [Marinobacter sp. SS21]MDC0663512.1 LapA family protein [Marinobacter sp. SS21]
MAGFRKLLILLVLLFLALLALVFSLNNQEPVSLNFLVFETPSHGVAVWIILAFVLGALAGILITLLASVRASVSRRQLQKRLTRAERALAHSRAENNRTI